MERSRRYALFAAFAAAVALVAGAAPAQKKTYDLFESPQRCAQCHREIHTEWKSAMMSQAYTHHWDEIEYFKLAVAQAEKDPKVAEVKAGCNGCHAPAAFFIGDTPPPLPSAGSRANESVACDICHTISGFKGDTPHNFNYVLNPGKVKYGPRTGVVSPHHETKILRLRQVARLLRHLPQREEPLRPVGQVHPSGVEGRPLQQTGRPLPGLPHVARPRQERRHGRGPARHGPPRLSPAPTCRPRSGASSS